MKITGVTVKTPEQLDVVMQVNQITLRFYKSFYFFITSPSYIMVKFRSSCFHCRRLCRTHFTLAETDLRGQWFFIWQHGHRIKKKKKMESWHNCLGIFLCHRVEKTELLEKCIHLADWGWQLTSILGNMTLLKLDLKLCHIITQLYRTY